MLVYILFFLLAYFNVLASAQSLALVVIGLFIFYYFGLFSPLLECALYFFGGCLYLNRAVRFAKKELVIAAILFIIAFVFRKFSSEATWVLTDKMVNTYLLLSFAFFVVFIFMFLFRQAGTKLQRLFRQAGNMTYTIYLTHISIQLILILLFYEKGRSFFLNNFFFCFYLIICGITGHLVFRYFERPAQNFLRSYRLNKFWFTR